MPSTGDLRLPDICPLFGLYALPVPLDLAGVRDSGIPEYMGVAPDELAVDALHNVAHLEVPGLAGNIGVEGYLDQQVTQFLGQDRGVGAVDGLQDLVGLLQQGPAQGFVRLLAVPGASAGSPELRDNFHQCLEFRYLAVRFVLSHTPIIIRADDVSISDTARQSPPAVRCRLENRLQNRDALAARLLCSS